MTKEEKLIFRFRKDFTQLFKLQQNLCKILDFTKSGNQSATVSNTV